MRTFKFKDNGKNTIEIQVECNAQIENISTLEEYISVQTTLTVLLNGEELDKGTFREFPALTYDDISKTYSVSPHYTLSGDAATVKKLVFDIEACYATAISDGASRDVLKAYYTRSLDTINIELNKQLEIITACLKQEQAEGYMYTNEDVYKKRLKWKQEHEDCELMPDIYSETDLARAKNLLENLTQKQQALESVLDCLKNESLQTTEAVLMAGVLKRTEIKAVPKTNIFERKAML